MKRSINLSANIGLKNAASIFVAILLFLLPSGTTEASDWGTLIIARVRYGGGGDWYTGPTSMPNLLKAASDRLEIPTRPDNIAVKISDHDLFNYPMLYLTGHGNVKFEDHEINRLMIYLENGGFLWINDSYGIDRPIRREFKRVFPDAEFVLLPADHPIYHTVYEFPEGLPKIHEHDGKPPAGYAIFIKGRMAVFYTYESDIGDGIEDEGVHPEDSPEVREKALRMALNILSFAFTQ